MPIPPRLLNGSRREYTIDRLLSVSHVDPTMPNERRLLGLVLPPWQRDEVWTVEQKIRFVEGLFLGLGSRYYVTNGIEWLENGDSAPMSGWLLDGQQRISALRDFILGDLVIFGDVTYKSFSKAQKLRFGNQSFPCFELSYCDNEDILKELYDRLNFGGTPHRPDQRATGGRDQ